MGMFNHIGSIDEAAGGNFGLIPVNSKHLATFSDIDWVTTKNGGHALKLIVEILEGDFKGRKIFEYITLISDSEKGVAISLRQFKSICASLGKEQLYEDVYDTETEDELEELMNISVPVALANQTFEIIVGIAKGTEGYDDKNKIKAYSAAPRIQPQKPSASSASQQPRWRQ